MARHSSSGAANRRRAVEMIKGDAAHLFPKGLARQNLNDLADELVPAELVPSELSEPEPGAKELARRQQISRAAAELGISPDAYSGWLDLIGNPTAAKNAAPPISGAT